MSKDRQMTESQLEDALQVVVVDLGDILSQVPEEIVDIDSRCAGHRSACGCSRMCYYVYTDHAQYTIKTYAKMALFRLVLTGSLSTDVTTHIRYVIR